MLLVQPPNSSSAATFGAGLKPPEAPGTIGVLANDPPVFPQLKSFVLVTSGLFATGLLAGAGSGAAQALSPQTSALEKFVELKEDVGFVAAGVVTGGDLAWLADKLKTELVPAGGLETAGAGAAAGAGLEKSKRSAIADDAGAGAGFGGGAGDAKPPKPPELPIDVFG